MYDIIYIGGGLNYAGAIIAAKKGLKVALIERDMNLLGGVCLHKGCIPSKMFLNYSHRVLKSQDEVFDKLLSLNMKTLVQKKDKLIHSAAKSVHSQCKDIDLIEGEGIIKEPYKVSVNENIYEARHIIIGTGSYAYFPEGISYDGKRVISSDEVLNLEKLPKEICVYGAGSIGLEMASFFASCGVSVRLYYRSENIQKNSHPLIQKALKKELEDIGIQFFEKHKITRAKADSSRVQILFENEEKTDTELLLVASGRRANLSVVDTQEINIKKGGIDINEYFQSSLKDHYAIGDCNAKLQLAHAARAQVINVTLGILKQKVKMLNLDNVVRFIHTLPLSYACVGQTKDILDKRNISYKESIVRLNHFTISSFHHAKNGLMIVYADEEGFILGSEVLAPDAQELISPVAMALAGEMDVDLASETIMAHPTFSEALERSFFHL